MRKKLILYYPALDPIVEREKVINTYIRHNCSIIDIAMPYKNTVLDGNVIKQSMRRIMEHHSEDDVFREIMIIKNKYPKLKVQLVAYKEQIFEYGLSQFVQKCHESQVDYFLSPNANISTAALLDKEFDKYNIPVIRFADFNMSKSKFESLKNAKGFLFQQSHEGLTGDSFNISPQLALKIKKYRDNGISIPIYVGFGISTKEHVVEIIKSGADGVIIGSALFEYFEKDNLDLYLNQFDEYFI